MLRLIGGLHVVVSRTEKKPTVWFPKPNATQPNQPLNSNIPTYHHLSSHRTSFRLVDRFDSIIGEEEWRKERKGPYPRRLRSEPSDFEYASREFNSIMTSFSVSASSQSDGAMAGLGVARWYEFVDSRMRMRMVWVHPTADWEIESIKADSISYTKFIHFLFTSLLQFISAAFLPSLYFNEFNRFERQ